MSIPPFLIPVALLFWGWQTEQVLLSLLFVIILEAKRFVHTRWELSRTDWSHVTDFCTILLLGALTAGFFHERIRIMFYVGKLLPCTVVPLLTAQFFSVAGKIDLASLSLIARKQKKSTRTFSVDGSYPFFLICLILNDPFLQIGLLFDRYVCSNRRPVRSI